MARERFRRIVSTLQRRQPDLTVVMEGVHKAHNLAAIARTCDCVGIGVVHAVTAESAVRLGHKSASGAERWVDVACHDNITEIYTGLRRQGFALVAADVRRDALDFRLIDYTSPCAIVVGAELHGLSPAAAENADTLVKVPLVGMVDSLNVSVAIALILFEAKRQRERAGFYDRRRLDDAAFARLCFEWMHPALAAYCRRRRLPYPRLDKHGGLAEPFGENAKRSLPDALAQQ